MSKFERTESNLEKEKIYKGAITIFYKKENEKFVFLVAKNTKTDNVSFVSGAKEDYDQDLLKTAQRENLEELGIGPDQYQLQEIDVRHEFVFGEKKKERAGHKGSYQVFVSNLTNSNLNISHTKELKGFKWMNEEEVLNSLTFPEMKEVFQETLNLIKL